MVALEAHTTKWMPEILHLLLELSDQPTQKTKLSDLHLLTQPDEVAEDKLTWAEIAKEDGWHNDRALWSNIDYDDSSDDAEYIDVRSEKSADSDITSVSSPAAHQRTIQALLARPESEDAALDQVERSQAWRYTTTPKDTDGRQHKTAISDYQLLREVLFMLSGLETSLFDSNCKPVPNYQLADVSWHACKALVTSFAEYGRSLLPLRAFVAKGQQVALLQVFRDAVQKSLRAFDRQISDIQTRFVVLNEDVVVSLIGIQAELKPSLAPLFALSSIVRRVEEERYSYTFRYLELLFEATGAAQSEGNEAVYRHLGAIFFNCFRVYLRPIRLWMEDGELTSGDRTFFVSQSTTKTPMSQLWRGQFKLRQTQAGVLHAPRFLHTAVKRIFTTGKSINVLKHLGRHESAREEWVGAEPPLDFASVCADDVGFAPFSELFNHAFNLWVQSKHHKTSATLRKVLFESCGLSTALDCLQNIYLGSAGNITDAFATPLFRHLDTLSAGWRDHFTLTEIAQEAFSPLVDSYRLSAKVDPRGAVHSGIASRASVRASLPAVHLAYRLDWPVQLIVSETGVEGYQGVFTFLLQLRRGAYVLRKHWVPRRAGAAPADHAAEAHRFYWLIRAKLLWFCETVAAYLTSIVLAPSISAMRENLRDALDVDDMINVHSAFISRITEELCLGTKLNPLRECMLDVLDLATKLEDVHRAEVAKETEEFQEISRLSVMSSPLKTPATQPGGDSSKRGVYVKPDDDDDKGDEGSDVEDILNSSVAEADKPYLEVLNGIHADYEKHLRFITGGLRGVARATRGHAAGKWDILAEMLEMGITDYH